MIAANGVTARYLEAKGFPSLRRVLRVARALGRASSSWPPRSSAAGCRAEPDARALEDVPRRGGARRIRSASPISRSRWSSCWAGASTSLELPGASRRTATSGSPCATTPTRPRRTGASRISITQRLLKAALAGRPAPYAGDELDGAGAALHRAGGQRGQGRATGAEVGGGAPPGLAHRRAFDAIVTGASPKGTWVRIRQPPVEGKLVRGSQGLDVGDRVRVELVAHRRRARLHRLRPGGGVGRV